MAGQPDLERLYSEHAQALFAFLLNFTRSEQDTRDALQEVFVKIARQPGLLSGTRNERSFLIRMAHNIAVDLQRRRAVRQKYHEELGEEPLQVFAADANPDEHAFQEALNSSLAELPPEQRAVVHLKLWEGLTFDEIARNLEIPLNTAASRYRYAIDKLRDLLRPFYREIQ